MGRLERLCRPRNVATAGLAIGLAHHARGYYRRGGERLLDLLPADLDLLESPAVMRSLGVQLMLFGGHIRGADGVWRRRDDEPVSLADRVSAIAPTWKAGGVLDYSWPGERARGGVSDGGSLGGVFDRSALGSEGGHGAPTQVSQLARTLERLGLESTDFDAPARATLRHMLTWRLPPPAERLAPTSELTLLVLSFDATPDCVSVADCLRPGPTNELLAVTASRFVSRRWREHGQHVRVIAQWEVAAAMGAATRADGRAGAEVTAVGTPGVFENTAEVYAHMGSHLGCPGGPGARERPQLQLVLLAHPDHLPRAHRIGQRALARAWDGCGPTSGPAPQLLPAMQPYSLDWHRRARAARTHALRGDGDGGGHGDVSQGAERELSAAKAAAAGSELDLFADAGAALVHTGGREQHARWDDEAAGCFPDGYPQHWAHRREVFIAYEAWARAKGVATGIM